MPTEPEITEKGLAYKADRMLKPPVSMLGVPAIHKLAKDITIWEDKSCITIW
jgi:hypothetical protein